MEIRLARRDDVPAILEIYNEAVLTTTATYDYQPQTLEQRLAWFEEHLREDYPIYVAEMGSEGVVGWASLSRFHPKTGYQFTAENTLYVGSTHRGQGVGKRLLASLIQAAESRKVRVIMALIDAENMPSIKLHQAFGFEQTGHLKQVGFKFDRWLDVLYMQRTLDRFDDRARGS